jgi:hypothetical protein
VNDDDGVFARFDHLVQITDRAAAHGRRQGAVVPDRLLAFEQEAADEVCRREVFMAGDGDERTPETPRHVLDEARLAAPRRAFEHDGQARVLRGLKQLHLAPHGKVERLVRDDVLFDGSLRHC